MEVPIADPTLSWKAGLSHCKSLKTFLLEVPMPAFSGLFGAGWAINSSEYFEILLPTLKSAEILREVAVSRAEAETEEKPSPWEGSLELVPDHGHGGASVRRGRSC